MRFPHFCFISFSKIHTSEHTLSMRFINFRFNMLNTLWCYCTYILCPDWTIGFGILCPHWMILEYEYKKRTWKFYAYNPRSSKYRNNKRVFNNNKWKNIIHKLLTFLDSCCLYKVIIGIKGCRTIRLTISCGLGLWCLTPLSTIFQLYRIGQFYWWGNRSTQRKPQTYRKSLKNFIIKCCIEYTSQQ